MKIKELEMYEKCYKKLFGRMLKKGKKIKNQNIYIYIKEEIKKKTETNPFWVIYFAFKNLLPVIDTKKKRLGSTKKEIPILITNKKQTKDVVSWLYNINKISKRTIELLYIVEEIILSYEKKSKGYKCKMNRYMQGIQNMYLIFLIKK